MRAKALKYHKNGSALGGLTDIEDIVPFIEFLVANGWWVTGKTIFAGGDETTCYRWSGGEKEAGEELAGGLSAGHAGIRG